MKEQFALAASKDVLKQIDAAADKAGLSRGQTFEDFLTFVRCSLAGQTMEEEYLRTVAKGYGQGAKGKRGIDYIVKAFGTLIVAMDETKQDVLGDIFTGGVTYGERGQFFTPDPLCELMSQLLSPDDEEESKSVNDPACGSGRALLAVGREHPHWEYTGQDVDHRCVQMTGINLGLNGLRGWAVWQNTLTLECFRVYQIGLNLTGGVIREVPVDQSPFHYAASSGVSETSQPVDKTPLTEQIVNDPESSPRAEPPGSKPTQLDLF